VIGVKMGRSVQICLRVEEKLENPTSDLLGFKIGKLPAVGLAAEALQFFECSWFNLHPSSLNPKGLPGETGILAVQGRVPALEPE
jgi:hypothetical protein